MKKLLSANMMRLMKNKCLWFFGLCVIGATLWYGIAGGDIMGFQGKEADTYDYVSFIVGVVPAFCTLFTGFFLGTEYSNKTIRNKLIAGHSRNEVYMAYLMTVIIATLIYSVMWFGTGIAVFVINKETVMWEGLLKTALTSVFFNSAFTSMLVFISVMIKSKAIAIIVQIEFARGSLMLLLMCGIAMQFMDEFLTNITIIMMNLLPMGQWVLSTGIMTTNPVAIPIQIVLSLIVTVLMTMLGIRLFEKKELR